MQEELKNDVEILETKDIKKDKKKKIKNDEVVDKLTNENALLNDKILRLSAEMQNMKRRNEEQVSNLLKYEGEDLVKQLLGVIDNFERAIKMDDTNLEDEVSKFLDGFKMIYANFSNILTNQGIAEIDCLNKAFDPNTMEAVLTDKVEGVEPNVVIDVLQKGYMYRGKVIRHAMVKVSE
ncbi:MAG: nucleotide exchange factor GrpE [Bacilli bacterium]